MGAKKAKKPTAKKGDDDGPDPKVMAGMLDAQLSTLRQRIVYEQERSMKSMAKTEELTRDKEDMVTTSKDEKQKTKNTVSEMTKRYKQMEEEFTDKIRKAEERVEE